MTFFDGKLKKFAGNRLSSPLGSSNQLDVHDQNPHCHKQEKVDAMVSYMFPPSSKHQGPHFPIPCCPEAFRCAVRHIETLDQYRGSIQLRQSPCLFKIVFVAKHHYTAINFFVSATFPIDDIKGESLFFQQHHLVSTDL